MGHTIIFEKGEEICTTCGRSIRNIIRVDGDPHGPRCGEKFLPRSQRQAVKDFDLFLAQWQREQAEAEHAALLDYAIATLPVAWDGKCAFLNKPTAWLQDWLSKPGRMEVPHALGVIAILASRGEL